MADLSIGPSAEAERFVMTNFYACNMAADVEPAAVMLETTDCWGSSLSSIRPCAACLEACAQRSSESRPDSFRLSLKYSVSRRLPDVQFR